MWRVDETFLPPGLAAFPPVIARILAGRGIHDGPAAHSFFFGQFSETRDPFLLPDMEAAVKRIRAAIDSAEQVAIYGDFDVDGITATAVLSEGLRRLGARVISFIPNRFSDGYGLSLPALERLADRGVTLILTVDCGVSAVAEARFAKARGVDLIVLDHHEVGPGLPEAAAVVNPKRNSSRYPTRDLCSAALALRLLDAVYARCGHPLDRDRYLNLVALATVCDMVPLVGENRELVRDGLRAMAHTSRPGVRALLKMAARPGQSEPPNAETLGFRLGPRINAAGRLADAGAALELLTTDDESRAHQLAMELSELNRQRQEMLERAIETARELAEQEPADAPVLVLGHPDISRGIVGLVAGRLAEIYGKPAFVFEHGTDACVGSARGVDGFDVVAALNRADDVLTRHGGHKAAGGFALRPGLAAEFRSRLFEAAEEQRDGGAPRRVLHIDSMAALSELNPRTLAYMHSFAPCGVGNPAPLLMSRRVTVSSRRAVGQGRHLMLELDHGRARWRAFAFNRGAEIDGLGNQIDIVYSVEKGSRGFGPRLRLLDWREPRNPTGVGP